MSLQRVPIGFPPDLHRQLRKAAFDADTSMSAFTVAAVQARLDKESVTIPRYDLDVLLAVATLYVNAFGDDEMMTLPEKLRLQEVEDVVKRYGERY
jgi:hypothetical protein